MLPLLDSKLVKIIVSIIVESKMNPNEYARLDGVALAAAIKCGDVSAMEVTEAAIGVIEKLNPKLNAVVMTNFDNARDVAKDVHADTPLAGVPFLLKDINQFSHDMPTTFSCAFFATLKAIFVAKDVFPIEGLPATINRSEGCKPPNF